jgi:hypothetical protein
MEDHNDPPSDVVREIRHYAWTAVSPGHMAELRWRDGFLREAGWERDRKLSTRPPDSVTSMRYEPGAGQYWGYAHRGIEYQADETAGWPRWVRDPRSGFGENSAWVGWWILAPVLEAVDMEEMAEAQELREWMAMSA